MPTAFRQRDEFTKRNLERPGVRKRRQAFEASEAMKDYHRAQDAARERLRVLREDRLAREVEQDPDA